MREKTLIHAQVVIPSAARDPGVNTRCYSEIPRRFASRDDSSPRITHRVPPLAIIFRGTEGKVHMSNVSELNSKFGVPGVVTIDEGKGGLARIRVTAPEGEAEIYLHGAHVTHFKPQGQKPVLFMSAESLFD